MQTIKKTAGIILLSGLFSGLIGCGGGGGGDGGGFTPTLPADAARISSANATDIANSVFGSIEGLTLVTGFRGADAPPSLYEILRLATDSVRQRGRQSASVASRTETENCDPSSPQGTITANVSETSNSATGFANFNNCSLGGLVINGDLTFTSSFNDTTGEYTDLYNGSLSFSFGADSFSMVFDLTENGNFLSGDFSTNVTFSVSGIPGGGFLVTTTQTLTGNGFGISGGQVIVQGAENTRLRITLTTLNTADVELDEGSGYAFLFTCPDLTCPI